MVPFLLVHLVFCLCAEAQNTVQNGDFVPSRDSVTSFQPSLPVVIAMLSVMFCLTFILLLYAKFCHRQSSAYDRNQETRPLRTNEALGIDKTVIESLPFFRFSLLKGSREGLECAVCLCKFNDVEILRLLPKCKHAFHIDCIDQWLGKHSSCPLCRQKVGINDLSQMAYSDSFRFLWNQSELGPESSIELYVESEENQFGSSRFRVGSSFRKSDKGKAVENLSTPEIMDLEQDKKSLQIFNRKVAVSEHALLKNRWSNVSSSDIMFLNSEMINHSLSSRFSRVDPKDHLIEEIKDVGENERLASIKHEMERKAEFESKIKQNHPPYTFPGQPKIPEKPNPRFESNALDANSKRSVSEIIVHPRFTEHRHKDSSVAESSARDERAKRIWLPIARKTIRWLANRETRAPLSPV